MVTVSRRAVCFLTWLAILGALVLSVSSRDRVLATESSSTASKTPGPSVDIRSPVGGTAVKGKNVPVVIVVRGGDYKVKKVEVFVDGVAQLAPEDQAVDPPKAEDVIDFYWDTTIHEDGPHAIAARITDTQGHVAEDSVSVYVENHPADRTPPSVTIVKPTPNEVVSGKTEIVVSPKDNSGIVRWVAGQIDGAFEFLKNHEPWSHIWDTTKVENGPHLIAVQAYDQADNKGAAETQVVVQNPAGKTLAPVPSVKEAPGAAIRRAERTQDQQPPTPPSAPESGQKTQASDAAAETAKAPPAPKPQPQATRAADSGAELQGFLSESRSASVTRTQPKAQPLIGAPPVIGRAVLRTPLVARPGSSQVEVEIAGAPEGRSGTAAPTRRQSLTPPPLITRPPAPPGPATAPKIPDVSSGQEAQPVVRVQVPLALTKDGSGEVTLVLSNPSLRGAAYVGRRVRAATPSRGVRNTGRRTPVPAPLVTAPQPTGETGARTTSPVGPGVRPRPGAPALPKSEARAESTRLPASVTRAASGWIEIAVALPEEEAPRVLEAFKAHASNPSITARQSASEAGPPTIGQAVLTRSETQGLQLVLSFSEETFSAMALAVAGVRTPATALRPAPASSPLPGEPALTLPVESGEPSLSPAIGSEAAEHQGAVAGRSSLGRPTPSRKTGEALLTSTSRASARPGSEDLSERVPPTAALHKAAKHSAFASTPRQGRRAVAVATEAIVTADDGMAQVAAKAPGRAEDSQAAYAAALATSRQAPSQAPQTAARRVEPRGSASVTRARHMETGEEPVLILAKVPAGSVPSVPASGAGRAPAVGHPAYLIIDTSSSGKVRQVGSTVTRRAYIVRPGENLTRIAARFGFRVDEIAKANGMTEASRLTAGQEIRLPREAWKILFDSTPIKTDVAPFICAGVPVAPFRPIVESKGGSVQWRARAHQVDAVANGKTIHLRIGSKLARVGQSTIKMDLAAFIKCGRTIVPVGFFRNVLDVEVECNETTGEVYIYSKR